MHPPDQSINRQRLKTTIGIGAIAPVIVSIFAAVVFPTAALAQTATTQNAAEAPSGFFAILFSGGVTGFIIVMILVALSVYSAYLIVEQILTVRRKDLIPPGLGETVQQALGTGDMRGARQACEDNPSLLSFVLMHGIAELEFGWNAVEKSLEDSLAEQAARMFRKIEYLSVIGNIAPMIGLLGTVIGMILAFQNVASTQGTASAPQLAEGIYQALVTTVGGLIVAIPSIGAFAIFRNRIDQFIAEAAHISQHVFTPLRRRAKKG